MQRTLLQRALASQLGRQCVGSQPIVLKTPHATLQNTRASASLAEAVPEVASTSGRDTNPYYWLLVPAAAAAVLGTSLAQQERAAWNTQGEPLSQSNSLEAKWVQQLASQSNNKVVLSAATMHNHPLLKKDHLFSNLHRQEPKMVEDLVCFYNAPERSLSYVIQLGKNVCGFPRIMHGGLTAAIVDESFGFLWLSLRSNGQLPFRGPAFTAHLEVDYKQKIPAGRLLLCTTEVESCEGRKLWMKATVRDGPSGKVYASARALFVCPKPQKLIKEGVKYAYDFFAH